MLSSIEDVAKKSEHEETLSALELDVDVSDQCQVNRTKRKIDLRICIVLGVMYTASLIDRVNLPVSTSSLWNLSATFGNVGSEEQNAYVHLKSLSSRYQI